MCSESKRVNMADTKNKITKYNRYSWLNIGTIIFGAIFIYMIISVIVYLTAKHVTSYEVMEGSISGNYRYTAIAAKTEEIQTADYTGYVTYYAREGARAGSGMTVATIGSVPTAEATGSDVELTEEDLSRLRSNMTTFALNFKDSSFSDVYNFKADQEALLLQAATTQDASNAPLLNQMNAPSSGFVLYNVDGFEDINDENISRSMFNRNNYNVKNLRTGKSVSAGEQLYKLITGEDWALYFPLNKEVATELQDRTSISFRFLKDDTTFSAAFSVVENGGDYFGKIKLHNSLVRYVSDRFLEIELILDQKVGLKVPQSAIDTQVFYALPQDYVIVNNDTDKEITLLRQTFAKDGSEHTDYITATVYDKTEDNRYLISSTLLNEGDYVLMKDTTKKHPVTDDDKVKIQGVYNINRGYAIFRQVTIVDENEEFCVVDPNNPYGLAAHDFIALDASSVEADDLIH